MLKVTSNKKLVHISNSYCFFIDKAYVDNGLVLKDKKYYVYVEEVEEKETKANNDGGGSRV